MRAERVPIRATYRVQFTPDRFRFVDATSLVPYLDRLGISHLYAAPHLKSRAGSAHGYDVVDHHRVKPELGSDAELEDLHRALGDRGMSMLVDWVPNHMGTGSENPLWMDVLENGPSSSYARFFDVDWRPVKSALTHRVLVPVLGDHYGNVLERGEIAVRYADGAFTVSYWDHRFPVGPRGYAMLLEHDLQRLRRDTSPGDAALEELLSILTAVKNLPLQTETDEHKLVERRREKEVIKRRLAGLTERSPEIRSHVDDAVRAINGTPGDLRSFERMHALLEMQGYRLAFWRVAAEEINYRRFFDVNELVAIRMEEPAVFAHAHRLLLTWIARGWIQAIRIDHPDGLFDPRDYFLRLKAAALAARCRAIHAVGGDSAELDASLDARCLEEVRRADRDTDISIFVEKILSREERLPESWNVTGTTGYDFLNAVNGLFVDATQGRALDRIYVKVTGDRQPFDEMVRDCKRLILETALVSEIQVLAHRLDEISEADPRTRDFTLGNLREALVETISRFPVYRTYVDSTTGQVHERDRAVVEQAIASARGGSPVTGASVFDFLRDILLARPPAYADPGAASDRRAFLGKFQQLTPPAMAKGIEDTAFYRFHRLVSLNEVGGEPETPPIGPDEFHRRNRQRQEQGFDSLLATSTHDTKRSEDARTRIDSISELADDWGRAVSRWMRMGLATRDASTGVRPAPGDEYLFYQSLAGVWPNGEIDADDRKSLAERLERYLIKAAREAKVHTSWINPSADYERSLAGLAHGVIARPARHAFWSSFLPLQRQIAWAGMHSSLAQVVLKLAAPGVPDFYQGCELWNLRLVDPDNREAVDFERMSRMLGDLEREHATPGGDRLAARLAASPADGRVKMFVTWRGLSVRTSHRATFESGEYVPLEVSGARARHVVAFARVGSDGAVVVVVGRLWLTLARTARAAPALDALSLTGEVWADTRVSLPASLRRELCDAFTGKSLGARSALDVADLLHPLPVALLHT